MNIDTMRYENTKIIEKNRTQPGQLNVFRGLKRKLKLRYFIYLNMIFQKIKNYLNSIILF